jgi:nucleotide-binding universal stress UspA family protein
MIPDIQRILYTTDLSTNSTYAFSYAIKSAIQYNAGIVVLHVLEPLLPATQEVILTAYFSVENGKNMLEEKITHAKERIKNRIKFCCDFECKEFNESFKFEDRIESIEVYEGYPAEEIIKKADELNCDAIVMGTHGKGILQQTFLGSTTKKVLRRARKPVLIIPLPKGKIDLTMEDME